MSKWRHCSVTHPNDCVPSWLNCYYAWWVSHDPVGNHVLGRPSFSCTTQPWLVPLRFTVRITTRKFCLWEEWASSGWIAFSMTYQKVSDYLLFLDICDKLQMFSNAGTKVCLYLLQVLCFKGQWTICPSFYFLGFDWNSLILQVRKGSVLSRYFKQFYMMWH